MRFEYLISEKGKRVPGTERTVRNCQRPKGRGSLLRAREPLCSVQEDSGRAGWLTDEASRAQACGWSPSRALHGNFTLC